MSLGLERAFGKLEHRVETIEREWASAKKLAARACLVLGLWTAALLVATFSDRGSDLIVMLLKRSMQ
jgi:hypothetical protein